MFYFLCGEITSDFFFENSSVWLVVSPKIKNRVTTTRAAHVPKMTKSVNIIAAEMDKNVPKMTKSVNIIAAKMDKKMWENNATTQLAHLLTSHDATYIYTRS